MKHTLIPLCALLAVTAAATAQDSPQADPFLDAVREHTHALTLDGRVMSGPGAAFLRARMDEADLFAMGEQHGTADIAEFATALYAYGADRGYGAYVMEVGPHSAPLAEALLEQGPDRFEAEARRHAGGLAFPFLFYAEEAALARLAATHGAAAQTALWGVDQEFVASGSLHAERLAQLAQTDAERDAAEAFAQAVNENMMAIGAGRPEPLNALAEAFAGNEDALGLIAALQVSNAIYAPFTGRGGSVYTANDRRERYMREMFLGHAARAEAAGDMPQKLFFKFGGNQMMRGRTRTHVMGFAAFLDEWAFATGRSFYNIMVECRGGQVTDPRSGSHAPCEAYLAREDSPFTAASPNGQAVVIDLAALRPIAARMADSLDGDVVNTVFAYDALVILPGVAPAGLIAAE